LTDKLQNAVEKMFNGPMASIVYDFDCVTNSRDPGDFDPATGIYTSTGATVIMRGILTNIEKDENDLQVNPQQKNLLCIKSEVDVLVPVPSIDDTVIVDNTAHKIYSQIVDPAGTTITFALKASH